MLVIPFTTSNGITTDSTCVTTGGGASVAALGADGGSVDAPMVEARTASAVAATMRSSRNGGGVSAANAAFRADTLSQGNARVRIMRAKAKLVPTPAPAPEESDVFGDQARAVLYE